MTKYELNLTNIDGVVKNEVIEMLKEAAHYGRMFSENDN